MADAIITRKGGGGAKINGTLESYTVAAGETIAAGDFVGIENNKVVSYEDISLKPRVTSDSQIDYFKWQAPAGSVSENFHVSSYVTNNKAIHPFFEVLNDSLSVTAYENNGEFLINFIANNGNKMTSTTPVSIATIVSHSTIISLSKISDTRVLIVYAVNNVSYARIINYNKGTPTLGTVLTINSQEGSMDLAAVWGDTLFVICPFGGTNYTAAYKVYGIINMGFSTDQSITKQSSTNLDGVFQFASQSPRTKMYLYSAQMGKFDQLNSQMLYIDGVLVITDGSMTIRYQPIQIHQVGIYDYQIYFYNTLELLNGAAGIAVADSISAVNNLMAVQGGVANENSLTFLINANNYFTSGSSENFPFMGAPYIQGVGYTTIAVHGTGNRGTNQTHVLNQRGFANTQYPFVAYKSDDFNTYDEFGIDESRILNFAIQLATRPIPLNNLSKMEPASTTRPTIATRQYWLLLPVATDSDELTSNNVFFDISADTPIGSDFGSLEIRTNSTVWLPTSTYNIGSQAIPYWQNKDQTILTLFNVDQNTGNLNIRYLDFSSVVSQSIIKTGIANGAGSAGDTIEVFVPNE